MQGETKALLDFQGQTALALLAALTLPSPCRTIVVGGYDAAAVAAEAERHGLGFVENLDWEQGQTTSLQCGLRAASADVSTDTLVLHPVDLPLVTQEDYDAVSAAYDVSPSDEVGRRVAATSIGMRRGHPIFFSAAVARELLDLEASGSARSVFGRHQDLIAHAIVSNEWVRRDLDHPEDYAAALAAFSARSN